MWKVVDFGSGLFLKHTIPLESAPPEKMCLSITPQSPISDSSCLSLLEVKVKTNSPVIEWDLKFERLGNLLGFAIFNI